MVDNFGEDDPAEYLAGTEALAHRAKYWDTQEGHDLLGGAKVIGIIIAIGFGLYYFFHHDDPPWRNTVDGKTAQLCMDWRIETGLEKRLDGPYIRDTCQNYFHNRSANDTALDNKYWQDKFQEANDEWKNYKQP